MIAPLLPHDRMRSLALLTLRLNRQDTTTPGHQHMTKESGILMA